MAVCARKRHPPHAAGAFPPGVRQPSRSVAGASCTACSRSTYSLRYVAWGLPVDRVMVLPNGTDPPSRLPAISPARTGTVFGFFGQMHRYKGLLELLQAMQIAQAAGGSNGCNIRLRVHGAYLEMVDPPYAAAVARLLEELSDCVTFLGAYRPRDCGRLMASVDCVVVPSTWWENAPLVIEEALAHRRPVIVSDIGGLAEKVRPGLDGYHFPVGDVAGLANLLLRIGRTPDMLTSLQATLRTPSTRAAIAARCLSLYSERRPSEHPTRRTGSGPQSCSSDG